MKQRLPSVGRCRCAPGGVVGVSSADNASFSWSFQNNETAACFTVRFASALGINITSRPVFKPCYLAESVIQLQYTFKNINLWNYSAPDATRKVASHTLVSQECENCLDVLHVFDCRATVAWFDQRLVYNLNHTVCRRTGEGRILLFPSLGNICLLVLFQHFFEMKLRFCWLLNCLRPNVFCRTTLVLVFATEKG